MTPSAADAEWGCAILPWQIERRAGIDKRLDTRLLHSTAARRHTSGGRGEKG